MTPFSDMIGEIERRRDSRVLVLAASSLDLEILPALFDLLTEEGRAARLDIVLYCRGGVANAARRLALLLHEFSDHLSFLVPHYCESSATIVTLAGHEIIAGPLAIFSPVDPHLEASEDGGPHAISAQDVRLFGEMARDWFRMTAEESMAHALSALTGSFFPTTLTSFYRSTLEIEEICRELLSLHMKNEALARGIVERLLFGYHSHNYALTREDLCSLGLPVLRAPEMEAISWTIAGQLRRLVGGASRRPENEEWFDALLVTRSGALVRRRIAGPWVPKWEPWSG